MRSSLAVIIVLTVLACTPPPTPPPTVNLVANSGFEEGGDSPASWDRDVFDSSAELDRSEVAYRGGRSVRIHAATPNDARWVQTISVEPRTVYELSGWILTEDVGHSAEPVDAGANLSVMGTWTRTEALTGTEGWTFRSVRFGSGDSTSITIAARLGFWSGTTTGAAWFDDVQVRPVPPQLPAKWDLLVLIYGRTDISFTGSFGEMNHVVAQMTDSEIAVASERARAFALQDLPALTSGSLSPTVTVRTPGRTLDHLSPNGSGWWPAPPDTAVDRPPEFDAVIVIWDPRGTNQDTGQAQWIGSAAGLTPDMGTGQLYATLIAEAAVVYPHRNVFKHAFGHSILSYFQAMGASPSPTVTNHATVDQYVHCPTGGSYVWQDESLATPIPNSIYNNDSGFTHDYYSGTVATAGEPSRCLGVTPEAWAIGGPGA